MKKYELYKIIIISPAPDRETVMLHALSVLWRQASHQLGIGFLKSAFF